MTGMHIPLDPTKIGSGAERLEKNLRKLIVGQDEAVQAVVGAYQKQLSSMHAAGHPIANFLFLGPTGSGKTRIVEATAECLLGNPRALVKIDCGEFQHSHEISKLIGSPPGYLGHRQTCAALSQEALDQFFTPSVKLSFVLFDEIEKASDALWNLLLGILDKGTLTLGDNRKVDFSRALIFMTSNLGATEMTDLLNPRFGFAGQSNLPAGEKLGQRIEQTAEQAARRKFTPEFINRLDKVVTFKPLGIPELRQILDIELRMVQTRIFRADPDRSFVFTASARAKELLLEEGTDTKYGARYLKRAIERLLVQPISNLIATNQVRGGDCIRIDLDGPSHSLNFIKELEDVPSYTMSELAGVAPPAQVAAANQSAVVEAARTWRSSIFR